LIAQHAVSDEDLDSAFESIDASLAVLIIDACNSRQVLDSAETRRGPMNSKGLAQLAYEKGMYLLTAARKPLRLPSLAMASSPSPLSMKI